MGLIKLICRDTKRMLCVKSNAMKGPRGDSAFHAVSTPPGVLFWLKQTDLCWEGELEDVMSREDFPIIP